MTRPILPSGPRKALTPVDIRAMFGPDANEEDLIERGLLAFFGRGNRPCITDAGEYHLETRRRELQPQRMPFSKETYKTPEWQTRPGANDFLQIKSVGNRC